MGERQLRNTLDLYMAYGSNGEIETQLLICGDLGYIELGKLEKIQNEIGQVERIVKALIKLLKDKHLNPGILESSNAFYHNEIKSS